MIKIMIKLMIIKNDMKCQDRLYINDYDDIILDVQTICTHLSPPGLSQIGG